MYWVVGLAAAVVLCPLACIRRQEHFDKASTLASVLVLASFCGLALLASTGLRMSSTSPAFSATAAIRLVGIAFFSFEGYESVLSAQGLASSRTWLLALGTVTIAGLYSGFAGMLAVPGEEAVTFGTLVRSLGCASPPSYMLNTVVILGFLIGYPAVTSPAMKNAEAAMLTVLGPKWTSHRLCNALRITLTLITVALAVLLHASFSRVVVFAGLYVCLPLALLVPAYAHICVPARTSVLDVLMLILGSMLMLAAAGVELVGT